MMMMIVKTTAIIIFINTLMARIRKIPLTKQNKLLNADGQEDYSRPLPLLVPYVSDPEVTKVNTPML